MKLSWSPRPRYLSRHARKTVDVESGLGIRDLNGFRPSVYRHRLTHPLLRYAIAIMRVKHGCHHATRNERREPTLHIAQHSTLSTSTYLLQRVCKKQKMDFAHGPQIGAAIPHKSEVTSLSYHGDGVHLFAATSADSKLYLINSQTGTCDQPAFRSEREGISTVTST